MKDASRPPVFIGSSTEGKRIAKAVNRLVSDWAAPRLWTQSVFLPGRFPIEDLQRQVRSCRFGLFVATPDDEVSKRAERSLVMRDNVLFEFGLFTGMLGHRRVFLLVPDEPRIGVPSDLFGLTLAEYDYARTGSGDLSEIDAALQVAADRIEAAISEEWRAICSEEEQVRRRLQASERGQAISRLFGVATRLYDAMWTIQRESLQTLLTHQTFDSVRQAALATLEGTAESYRSDAEIAGATAELEALRAAIARAIEAVPNPRELVSAEDAAQVGKAVAVDGLWAWVKGGDVVEVVRSSATERARPQYEALAAAYSAWWDNVGPSLEKSAKAMSDALAHASLRLGLESTRT